MNLHAGSVLVVLSGAGWLAGCGGGSTVETHIDEPPRYASSRSVILTGQTFTPPGSHCPNSSEFVIIGRLGPHTLRYHNAATGVQGPVFDDLWVCNADGGRRMAWTSNPIELAPGNNLITVTMEAAGQRSLASVTLRPFGS